MRGRAVMPFLVGAAWLAGGAWLTHGFTAFTSYTAALAAAGPTPRPAPDARFVDQTGAHRTLSSLRGRWLLVNFLYYSCPDACPLVTSNLGAIGDRLAREAPHPVELVSLDFDRDPPAAARRMWQAHGAPEGWTMGVLDGDGADEVLRRFGVYARRRADGLINHALWLFLVAPDGTLRHVFSPDEGPDAIARAVAREQAS